MTVETNPPEQAGYRWNITFVVRTDYHSVTGATHEVHRTVTDADELVNIILHSSHDPRVVAYRYERQPALDLSGAPRACPDCGRSYGPFPPQQRWHGNGCTGHLVFQCTRCGQEEPYPELTAACH